jgi:hypothetical protein
LNVPNVEPPKEAVKQFETAETTRTRLGTIHAGIWALGFVSLVTDVSSEMIQALLPVQGDLSRKCGS